MASQLLTFTKQYLESADIIITRKKRANIL